MNWANDAAKFIYVRTYSRWLDKEGRREEWPETVDRYLNFIKKNQPDIPKNTIRKIKRKRRFS